MSTPASADGKDDATASTIDLPLDLAALKRVSLKWNPFSPKPKTPASGSEDAQRRAADESTTDPSPSATQQGPADPATQPASPTPSSTAYVSETRLALERKVVDSLCALFGAGQFFFSYDTDITRSPVTPGGVSGVAPGGSSGLPLWRRVRREFWWNEWLSNDLTEIGVGPPSPLDPLAAAVLTHTFRTSRHTALSCLSCKALFRYAGCTWPASTPMRGLRRLAIQRTKRLRSLSSLAGAVTVLVSAISVGCEPKFCRE